MPANKSLKSLWRSLNFTAQLAGLTTVLIAVTIPLTLSTGNHPTQTKSSAYTPVSIPTPTPVAPNRVVRPVIDTTILPNAVRNRTYSATVSGSETKPQADLSLTAQNLPQGITLGDCVPALHQSTMILNCRLSGQATDTPGAFPITFRLIDAGGATTVKILNLTLK